ncbi:MAG: hypothetical protein IPP15_13815 [Saprospiraceae bacterium]|uniref:Uncharacterized protein n=1 Tax=Candidatus Opimibacter skivensis TaxID=2982028 RepID=A0A9D7XPR7_9BACT|nr:hypothetical protein [Candidatus Opimibacter skivensis]
MPKQEFKRIRSREWFRNIGTGIPGNIVTALYVGINSAGETDLLGEGEVGKTYPVVLLSKSAVLAPCPDFCDNDELPDGGDEKIIAAFKILAKTINP